MEAAGCYCVVYDTRPRSTLGVYEVIHLSTIVCRHHLVPTFAERKVAFILPNFTHQGYRNKWLNESEGRSFFPLTSFVIVLIAF
jgi:hypothetical protein